MTGAELTAAVTALLPGASQLISEAKRRAAQHPSAELTLLYWQIRRLAQSVLKGQRAAYGKEGMARLSKKVTNQHGRGWSAKPLRHCLRVAETFHFDSSPNPSLAGGLP